MEKLCEKCKKAVATGYWSINTGDKTVYKYLCEDCFSKVSKNSQLDDYFRLNKTNVDFRCKDCGTSFSEFEDTLILGCPNCYNNFKKQLEPIIDAIQYGNEHIGKTPDVYGQTRAKIIRRKDIKS